MSFILDALRKSEAERQREAMPTVARAPVAPARRQVPVWSWALIAALSLAIVTLGLAWWRSTAPDPASNGTIAASVPAGANDPDLARAAGNASAPPSPRTGSGLPSDPQLDGQPRQPSQGLQSTASVRSPSVSALPSTGSPLPDEPLSSDPRLAVPRPIGELSLVDSSQPSYRLDLLAYHSDPSRAYALINGERYVPGQRMTSGPTVTEVRSDGVVLSYRGQTFLLRPR